MDIGSVHIASKLALAPMAGVTDAAYRQICSELGAGLTYTELVSAKALCYQDKKSRQLLMPFPGEGPFAAQIFGSDVSCMAEAAQIAAEVNAQLSGESSAPAPDGTLYRVQVGAYSVKSNADAMLAKVKAAGFDTYMVQAGGYYKIQVGAYSVKSNADAMLAKVKAAGFDAFIMTTGGTAAKLTNPYPVPTRTIKYIPGQPTMTGEDVKWVQWVLVQAGYNIEIDGKFGPASAAALKAYQAAHGLEVDGKCGPATRACMQAA